MNMLPSMTTTHVTDVRLIDTISLGEQLLGFGAAPDCAHDLIGQFGGVVPFSMGDASLRDSIADVISACPEKEVGRIAADSVIALVEHPQSAWDRAIGDDPGKSVGGILAIIPSELAVTSGSTATSPRPAIVWTTDGDPRPELGDPSFWTKLVTGHLRTSYATVVRDRKEFALRPVPLILALVGA